MQFDPVAEWHRLAEFYREKSDGELEELAEDFGNLTETAQQVLTDELRSRRLSVPGRNQQQASTAEQTPRDARFASSVDPDVFAFDTNPGGTDADSDEDAPHEYTWKTVLCGVDDSAEAYLLRDALSLAGIESWIDNRANQWGLSGPKILVAADQLDEARAIAARPIPQDIVEASTELDKSWKEYVPPTCPKCRTEDPVLESADPTNSWLCEACGARWSDPLPDPDDDSGADPARPPK
jgi:hypothetical protein